MVRSRRSQPNEQNDVENLSSSQNLNLDEDGGDSDDSRIRSSGKRRPNSK